MLEGWRQDTEIGRAPGRTRCGSRGPARRTSAVTARAHLWGQVRGPPFVPPQSSSGMQRRDAHIQVSVKQDSETRKRSRLSQEDGL